MKIFYFLLIISMATFHPCDGLAQKTYKKKKKDPANQPKFGSTTTSLSRPGKKVFYWENGNMRKTEWLNKKLFREKEYKEWYEDGTLKIEEKYENGRKVGPAKAYYPSGKLHTSYHYKLETMGSYDWRAGWLLLGAGLNFEEVGVLHGRIEEYYENGNQKKLATYKEGLRDGEYSEWYESGQLLKRGFISGKFNNGDYKEYHENGSIKLTGEYVKNQKVGKWVSTHDNGKTHYVKNYETNNSGISSDRGRVIDGPWESYYADGSLEFKGQYENGRQEGVWKEHYSGGQEKSTVKYKDGKQIGMYLEYHANGQKKTEGEFGETARDINRARKEGTWTEWHENGQKRRVVAYKNGRREGPSEEWYDNGQMSLRTTYIFSGKKESMFNGLTTSWHENGQEKYSGVYDMGRKDGEWKEYASNGNLKLVGNYDAGKAEGIVTIYYKNGNKKSRGEYKMSKSQTKTGNWNEWYENGQLKFEGGYINGKLKGQVNEFYENGQLWREAVYDDGVFSGFVREFYEDGSKKIDGGYCTDATSRGLKCGPWQVWSEDGTKVKDEKYDKGKRID